MPSDEAVPPQSRIPLDAALASVLERLNSDSDVLAQRVEITRELSRLRELFSAERARRSVVERLQDSLGSEVAVAVDLPESEKSASSPSDELVANLAAHSPRESRYEIRGEIARGGMGAILHAFDPDLRRPLAMKVALERAQKSDDKQRDRIARFLEEAQITGQLDHPGVVPVHELGLDPAGRLYFTMRLVKGRDLGAIYELARSGAEGWSITRVLGVLLKVCEAMAYAHSKGVIHRDLKPANVMVGRFGEVYVMDWGLAKVIGRKDGRDLRVPEDPTSTIELHSVRSEAHDIDPTTPLLTLDGTVLGTPAYMSPEQARGEIERMDARSDVYALGAMLYQLLAGIPPYQDGQAKHDARKVWMRILQSGPAPLHSLAPQTAPELLAIVERAMARELSERYPGMQALGDDLRAWLEGRVVQAYETGNWARARKWLGRNKPLAASIAAGVLVLIGGSGVSSYYAFDAKEQAKTALGERDKARRESATSAQVLSLVTGMYASQDPSRARGELVTVRELLDSNARQIDSKLPNEPLVRAKLMQAIATVYQSLGLYDDAEALLSKALSIRRQLLGEADPETLATTERIGEGMLVRGQVEQAEPLFKQVLALRERTQGPEHPDTLRVYSEMLGPVYDMLGRSEEAERCYLRALDAQRRTPGPRDAATLATLNNLAVLYYGQKRFDKAEALFSELLEARSSVFGAGQVETVDAAIHLAVVLREQGRLPEAERLLVEACDSGAAAGIGNDPVALKAQAALGQVYSLQGRLPQAEAALRRALEGRRRVLPGHPDTWTSMYDLAVCLHSAGKSAEALELAYELIESAPADAVRRPDFEQLLRTLEKSLEIDPAQDGR